MRIAPEEQPAQAGTGGEMKYLAACARRFVDHGRRDLGLLLELVPSSLRFLDGVGSLRRGPGASPCSSSQYPDLVTLPSPALTGHRPRASRQGALRGQLSLAPGQEFPKSRGGSRRLSQRLAASEVISGVPRFLRRRNLRVGRDATGHLSRLYRDHRDRRPIRSRFPSLPLAYAGSLGAEPVLSSQSAGNVSLRPVSWQFSRTVTRANGPLRREVL